MTEEVTIKFVVDAEEASRQAEGLRTEMAQVEREATRATQNVEKVGKEASSTASELSKIGADLGKISPQIGTITKNVNQLSQALKKMGVSYDALSRKRRQNARRGSGGAGAGADVLDVGYNVGASGRAVTASRVGAVGKIAGVASIAAIGASLFGAITGSGSKLAGFDKLNTLGDPSVLDGLLPEAEKIQDETKGMNESLGAISASVAAISTAVNKIAENPGNTRITIENPAEVPLRWIVDDRSEQTVKERRAEIEKDVLTDWTLIPEIDLSKKKKIDDQREAWAEPVTFAVDPELGGLSEIEATRQRLAETISYLITAQMDGTEEQVEKVRKELAKNIVVSIGFDVDAAGVLEPTISDAQLLDAILDAALVDLKAQSSTALDGTVSDAMLIDSILDKALVDLKAQSSVALDSAIIDARLIDSILDRSADDLATSSQTALDALIADAYVLDAVLDGSMDELSLEAATALSAALRHAMEIDSVLDGAMDELSEESKMAIKTALAHAKTLTLLLDSAMDVLTEESGQALKGALNDALTLQAVLDAASDELTTEAEMGVKMAVGHAMLLQSYLNSAADELSEEAGNALKGALYDALAVKMYLDSAMDDSISDAEIVQQIISMWGQTESGSVSDLFRQAFVDALTGSLAVGESIDSWGRSEDGIAKTFSEAFTFALQASGIVGDSVGRWGSGLDEYLVGLFSGTLQLADQVNNVVDNWFDGGTASVISAVASTFEDIISSADVAGAVINGWFPTGFGSNAIAAMRDLYNYAVATAQVVAEMNGTSASIPGAPAISSSGTSATSRVSASSIARATGSSRSYSLTETVDRLAQAAQGSTLYGTDGGLSKMVKELLKENSEDYVTTALVSAGVSSSAATNLIKYANGEIGTIAYQNAMNVIRNNGGIVTGESYGEKARNLGYDVKEFTQEQYERASDLMMEALLNPTASNVNALEAYARSFANTITAESYAHYGTSRYGAGYELIDQVASELGLTNSELIGSLKARVEKDYDSPNGVELADTIGRLIASDSKASEYLAEYTKNWKTMNVAGQQVKGLDELGDGTGYWVVNPNGELQYITGGELAHQKYSGGRFYTDPNAIIHNPRQSTFSIDESTLDHVAGTDYYKSTVDGKIYYKYAGGYIEQKGIDFDPDRARAIEGERGGRIQPVELDTGGYVVTGADGQPVYVPYGSSIYEDSSGHIYSIPDIQTDGNNTWYLDENNQKVMTGTIADPDWGVYKGGRNSGVLPSTGLANVDLNGLQESIIQQVVSDVEENIGGKSWKFKPFPGGTSQSQIDMLSQVAENIYDKHVETLSEDLLLAAMAGPAAAAAGVAAADIAAMAAASGAASATAAGTATATGAGGGGIVSTIGSAASNTLLGSALGGSAGGAFGIGGATILAGIIAANELGLSGPAGNWLKGLLAGDSDEKKEDKVETISGYNSQEEYEQAVQKAIKSAVEEVTINNVGRLIVAKDPNDPEAGNWVFAYKTQADVDNIERDLFEASRLGPTAQQAYLENMERIYHYAIGGVFQPNKPQLAILGDNRNEPEVAAPYSLIVQAVTDALRMASPMSGGGADDHITIDIPVTLDGRVIARATYDYLKNEERRRNGSVVA